MSSQDRTPPERRLRGPQARRDGSRSPQRSDRVHLPKFRQAATRARSRSCSGSRHRSWRSGCHVTTSTLANMPSVTVSCQNSKPCFVFNGSTSCLNTSGLATQTQPLTVSFVGERTGNFTSFQTTIGEGTGHLLFGWSAANSMALYAQSNVETATATDSVLHAAQMFLNDVSSSFYIDGTSTGVGATPGTAFFSNVTLSIGNASSCSGGGFSLTGSLFEVGLWNGNQTSNNSTMNSNQHSYWGF